MDGNGTLFGTLSGNTREIMHKFSVDLPKKHGRGGQSALRFARLRMEKRHNYVRKVSSRGGGGGGAAVPAAPRHYCC
jgi:peptide chain release factor subunit 1